MSYAAVGTNGFGPILTSEFEFLPGNKRNLFIRSLIDGHLSCF